MQAGRQMDAKRQRRLPRAQGKHLLLARQMAPISQCGIYTAVRKDILWLDKV
jgi:hypothetical protein